MLIARLPRPRAAAARGVTLIELLVAFAVLAIGLAAAAPSLTSQIAAWRVQGAAESIVGGLNYARAEAVRRNRAVAFTLDAAGRGWSVAQVSPALVLQGGTRGELAGITATPASASRVVTFTPTGMVDATGDRLSRIDLAAAGGATPTRRVDIFGGGLIRLCDPQLTSSEDPRRC